MQRAEIETIELRDYWELAAELATAKRRGDNGGEASAALALSVIAADAESPRLRDAAAKLIAPYAAAIEARVAAVILREHATR